MKVLLDYHHHDLWESMELLCERLGWTLLRPIGMEWFDEGYWNFERAWHGDRVARQYLETWGSDVWYESDGWTGWTRLDHSHKRRHKLVTLEQARAIKPDIVIASVAHNHEGLARFASEVGATFGIHLGNVRFSHIDMKEDRWDLAKFGIVTTNLPEPVDTPHVVVHQEFALGPYVPPALNDPHRVASFVNCFAENERGYAQFREVAHLAPDLDWRVFGSYGSVAEDEYAAGNIGVCADVAKAMQATDIAWHTKQWSDGFGHVIHNWFAVGRPVVGFQWYYKDQLAGPLWQEGVTSYDITDKPADDVRNLIRSIDDDAIRRMSENAYRRFREVVNFDEEEQAIRAMFAQVLP
jgi:glycosyltransferase involved in cell wall biosynthesis